MKIYTRQGDDGSTGLFGGQRLSKSDPRFECIGTIDELNASLGLAAVTLDPESAERVQIIQNELFVIGSQLGSAQPTPHLPQLDEQSISRLEREIDEAEGELSPLKNFILPGGTESAARLHLARTICRRAERGVAEFARTNSISPIVLKFLNRLSDWLFVQARLANHRAGVSDVIWNKPAT